MLQWVKFRSYLTFVNNKGFSMFIFISACRGTDQDQVRTDKLRKYINSFKMSFEEVEGCYKGQTEKSFKVKLDPSNTDRLIDLMIIAEYFKQESIMRVQDSGDAELIYIDSKQVEYIGKFQEVESIEGLDAYSVIDGKFYSVK